VPSKHLHLTIGEPEGERVAVTQHRHIHQFDPRGELLSSAEIGGSSLQMSLYSFSIALETMPYASASDARSHATIRCASVNTSGESGLSACLSVAGVISRRVVRPDGRVREPRQRRSSSCHSNKPGTGSSIIYAIRLPPPPNGRHNPLATSAARSKLGSCDYRSPASIISRRFCSR